MKSTIEKLQEMYNFIPNAMFIKTLVFYMSSDLYDELNLKTFKQKLKW